MHLDIGLVFCIVIAAVCLGRLWSVLGTRNDGDPQRPNPFSPSPKSLPGTEPMGPPPAVLTSPFTPPLLPPNSLAGGLAQIKAVYPDFEEKPFLQEVKDIFSSIISAYAANKLSSVSEFLSPTLFAHFQNAATARAAAGQTAQSRIVRIKDEDITTARADGTQIFITVKFISDQENILRNERGTVIGGAEGKYEEIVDLWVFARNTAETNTKWVVVETKS